MEFFRVMFLAVFVVGTLAMLVASMTQGRKWFFALTVPGRVALLSLITVSAVLAVYFDVRIQDGAEAVWTTDRRWARLPLRVRAGTDLRSWEPQLESAMRLWNEQLGCDVFVRAADDGQRPDVRVVFTRDTPCDSASVVEDKAAAAGTYYCGNGTADIEVHRLDEIKVAYRIFAHEFGHVLGLGHDLRGLMAESIVTTDDSVEPSRKDRAALTAWYCTDAGRGGQ